MEVTTVDINDVSILVGFAAATISAIAYGGYRYGQLESKVNVCTADIKELDETMKEVGKEIAEVKGIVMTTQTQINSIEKTYEDIRKQL